MTMTPVTRRALLASAASAIALPGRATARPVTYRLDPDVSTVGFRYWLNGLEQAGSMPVTRADIVVDPTRLTASTVTVELDVANARTALPFATEALTGPSVLDAANHPTIRFVSTRVTLGPGGRISEGARIAGWLTIRGVTLPVVLDAALYRPRGSPSEDLSRLSVRLSGEISRAAFGATGFPDLVDDRVGLDVQAEIEAVD